MHSLRRLRRASSLSAASLAAALWVAASCGAGCGTVDPGPNPGPPAACNAPPAFFVSDVWPKYFAQYSCGKSDCHDAQAGHGYFRLTSVTGGATPQPTDPLLAWPPAWRTNFLAVTQSISCTDPIASAVLAVPEGKGQPHPPGVVVTDLAAADTLFRTWLK